MNNHVELIEFKEPEQGQVYVSKINWPSSCDLLVQDLRQRFEPFGLIHCIKASQGQDSFYAYINYYSSEAAQKAISFFLKQECTFQGQPCKIQRKTRDNVLKKGRPLYVNQCEDLANFYLGFNGWSSKILYHNMESFEGQTVTFATAVQLTFSEFEGQIAEGVGLAKAEFSSPEEKSVQIAIAQKSSKSAAVMNAFSKVILALIHNDDGGHKVMVRIDPSRKDPFHYNSIWNSSETDVVQVQNLSHVDEDPDLFEK